MGRVGEVVEKSGRATKEAGQRLERGSAARLPLPVYLPSSRLEVGRAGRVDDRTEETLEHAHS